MQKLERAIFLFLLLGIGGVLFASGMIRGVLLQHSNQFYTVWNAAFFGGLAMVLVAVILGLGLLQRKLMERPEERKGS